MYMYMSMPLLIATLLKEFLKTSKYPVIIISYEMFLRTHDSLKRVRFDVVVCDEGHRLKNNSTKTTSVDHTHTYMYIVYMYMYINCIPVYTVCVDDNESSNTEEDCIDRNSSTSEKYIHVHGHGHVHACTCI